MKIQQQIEHKIKEALEPVYLEVVNESSRHHVPKESESHFMVIVVSPKFDGQELVVRHRLVYDLLTVELKNDIHALSLQTWTPEEWSSKMGKVLGSPPCLGGPKDE